MANVWNTTTIQSVMARFNSSEKAALAGLQSDPDELGNVLARAIAGTRGKIKAGGYVLGPDGTVPDSLADETISIALWRWLSAFPKNDKLQTDQRKQLYTDALATLKDVSTGKQRVELPDPGVTDQSIEPAIQPRRKHFGSEDGI